MAWKRDKNLIAERFGKDELPGFLTKEFDVKGDEFVVLEKNREIYLEKDHGKLSVSSFMGDFTDVIMVDKSEKTLENEIKNVFLADGRNIGIKLTIKFRIFNSDHFSKNMMGQRKKLFLDDVWNEMVSDVVYKKILPKLQKKPAKDFASEDFREKAKANIEADVKRKFREWGLMLTSLSMSFNVPEEPKEELGEEEKVSGEEEFEGVEKHAKAGMTIEDETEELEKERLEKEVTMELEKKQMQKDVEDAMEAMELKDIQERKRVLKETEAKENERKKLIEEMESLKKAKEITERKFYKKELSEESFQRMMEDFEKRIIEIETKLRTK